MGKNRLWLPTRRWACIALVGVVFGVACRARMSKSSVRDRLTMGDDVARVAVQQWVERGELATAEIRPLVNDADPIVRRYARMAMGRITGQWGSDGTGILWKRSVDEAVGQGKPILVLHLFGKFDEEFC